MFISIEHLVSGESNLTCLVDSVGYGTDGELFELKLTVENYQDVAEGEGQLQKVSTWRNILKDKPNGSLREVPGVMGGAF